MSMDPGAMQQLLSQQLQQPQVAGGGMAGPQMQGSTATPMGIGAQVAQKLMLMKALQAQQPQAHLTGMPPPPQPIQQANPALQQTNPMMQQQPLPGAQNV